MSKALSPLRAEFRQQIAAAIDALPDGYSTIEASRALGELQRKVAWNRPIHERVEFNRERERTMKLIRTPKSDEPGFFIEVARMWIRKLCPMCDAHHYSFSPKYALKGGCMLCAQYVEELNMVIGCMDFRELRERFVATKDLAIYGVVADVLDDIDCGRIAEEMRKVWRKA